MGSSDDEFIKLAMDMYDKSDVGTYEFVVLLCDFYDRQITSLQKSEVTDKSCCLPMALMPFIPEILRQHPKMLEFPENSQLGRFDSILLIISYLLAIAAMVESNEKDLAMVEASIAAFVDQLTSSQDQLNLIKNHISALKEVCGVAEILMKLGVADQSEVPTVCLFKDHFNEIKSTASQKMIVDGEIESVLDCKLPELMKVIPLHSDEVCSSLLLLIGNQIVRTARNVLLPATVVTSIWDAIISQLKCDFYLAPLKLGDFMLNVHYVVPAKMPEVIGRTVSFTISFLEGEGEPERPDRPREIMARLLGRIIEKLANPAGLVDLVFACIQLPTVVKLLSRLSTAICLPSLEPIEQSLLNPLLQLMTALVRIVGKFAFASVSGAGDILVSSMDAICTCIERYKLDRKIVCDLLAHCILSDLSVAKVLKWRIPEIFDLTFDDLMDLPPKFESVPSVSTLPFVCYQIEKCGGKDFDPTSLSRSRAILDSLLVVLMVLKKNSIPQPAFTLVSELISRTTEKWTGRQIVSGFIQSSAKEMEFIEWLGIFHNLSIMTKWVQLNDKLLNLIAALSSFPWLNERSSFESDDMVVFAENWAKLVNLAANLSQESDLINKCLIVLSSLPSQVCPKWRKRVMKTHLQLYNGEKAMEFWLQNIPLYVATMGSGCFGDFIEGTFSPAVLCANAYQPGVMEMYFKALSQLVCLKCNCTKLRWTYIGSHSLNGKLTDSIFIPTINCSKTCDSLPGELVNVPSDWFSKKIFSLLSDDYVDSRKALCNYLCRLLCHCQHSPAFQKFVKLSLGLMEDCSFEVKSEYSNCLGLIAERELVTDEMKEEFMSKMMSLQARADIDDYESPISFRKQLAMHSKEPELLEQSITALTLVILKYELNRHQSSLAMEAIREIAAYRKITPQDLLMESASCLWQFTVCHMVDRIKGMSRLEKKDFVPACFDHLASAFGYIFDNGECDWMGLLKDYQADILANLFVEASSGASEVLRTIACRLGTNRQQLIANNIRPIIVTLVIYDFSAKDVQFNDAIDFMLAEGNGELTSSGRKLEELSFADFLNYDMQNIIMELMLNLSVNRQRILDTIVNIAEHQKDNPIPWRSDKANKWSQEQKVMTHIIGRYGLIGLIIKFESSLKGKLTQKKKSILTKSLIEFMTIAKGKCLTHVRMKVMAVLRLMLSETNSDGRKLCCEAWQAFVKNLQLECLTSLLPQIVVSILPMTKSDLLSCTPLLTDIFVTSRNSLKKEIDQLAFVINVPEYSHLKKFLPNSSEIEKNLSLQVLVERCLEMLQNENPEVKALALGKLLNVLEQNQRELHRLILDSDVIDDFICTLVDSLIKTIRYDSAEVKLLTAKCLGLIGAIDPGKLDTDWSGETTMRLTVSSYNDYTKNDAPVEFPVQLLAELARVLSSVPDGAKFNACSYAIQEILKYFRCTPDEVKSPAKTLGSRIWEELSESLRETIEPMLTSRYCVKDEHAKPSDNSEKPTLDRSQFISWIEPWLNYLISKVKDEGRKMCYFHCSLVIFCDTNMAVFLMPHVILILLLQGDITPQIEEEFLTVLMDTTDSKNAVDFDRLAAQVVFSVLDYLSCWLSQKRKMFTSSMPQADIKKNKNAILQIESFMKKIPQKLLSTAAFACHNYTRSLRHLECHIREQVRAARDNKSGSQSDQFAVIQKEIPSLQEIYAKLDEPDNVWGALDIRKQMREPSYREHILAYESTGNFTEALPFHDLAAKAHPENVSEQKAQINCLLKLNQPFIAFNCVGKIMETNPEWQEQLIAHRMEAAWKLQDWKGLENSLPKTESFTITNNWDVTIGQLLLGIHNRQATEVQKKLSVAREKLIAGFSTANMEGNAYERAYMYVCRMHSVTEIEQFVRCQMEGKRESTALTPETLLAIWRDRQKLVQRSSTMLEPILEMRRTLLGLSGNSSGDFYKRETAYLWLQSAKMARKAGHLQSAWSYLTNAKEFRLPETFVEEAKLYRLKGQSERAIDTLTSGIREFYSPIEKLQGLKSQEGKKTLKSFAKAQLLLAEYSKDAAAGDFDGVSVLYQKAFSACPDSESTQYAVATFLDGDSWRRNSDQLNIVTVVRRYAGSLEFGSQHLHHSMPRLLTLWLDFTTALHSDQVKKLATKSRSSVSTGKLEESKEVPGVSPLIRTLNKELELLLQRGPLYYFYTALSQMLSRLCHPNDEVAATLIKIVSRVIATYPERALWQLVVVARSSNHPERNSRARELIQKAVELNPQVKVLYNSLIKLTNELVRVCSADSPADFPAGGTVNLRSKFESLAKLSDQRNFRNILIPFQSFMDVVLPTVAFGERPDLNYNPFVKQPVYIESFLDGIVILNSMQRPKRLTILGTDGHHYSIMCKPKEDLRQDSRLMELNALVNRLLRRDQDGRRRRLYVRTYNVVPFNEECGILEWVPNLKGLRPILLPLLKEAGKDMSSAEVRKLLNPKLPADEVLKNFTEVLLPAHPPMLSEWFRRAFPDPSEWYLARGNFIHTTAVMSILGFVLGLGDRHGENLNLDAKTGDIFHVDFNCLFNAGVALAQPELVPFRLTQSMIEAMGPLGIEGSFKRSCEVTMRVLRDNKEMLKTVLQSFLHDPLNAWLVKARNPTSSAQGRQGLSNVNEKAKFHLKNIEFRLDGYVKPDWTVRDKECISASTGYIGPLSVEAQVGELIKQATSINLLAQMYHGWSAYL